MTWWKPGWAIALLLALLPFFAHHPVTPLAHTLVALTAVVQIVYLVRRRPSWRGAWRAVADNPLLLLAALFVAAAFLSLSSLPLGGLWHEYRAAADPWPLTAWPRRMAEWMRLGEARREFPITSAFLTLQGFVLALMVWRETRLDRTVALRFPAAITAGTLAFIGVGLLGALGAVNMEAWRGSTMVETRPGTLQSTAGNPGWFAEYLVYSLPYALVLLAGTAATTRRVAWLAAVTALTSLALVVSGQRGGWIAGVVVVVYMAAAGPTLLSRDGARMAVLARLWRAMAALAIVMSLVAGGFWVWLAVGRVADASFGATAYLERLKSIGDGDRLAFLPVSLQMARLHPLLGGGHEGFAYLYRQHFEQPDGRFHGSPPLVQPASAHNVYLQTLTGTGAVGLALLLGIFAVAARRSLRGVRLLDRDRAGTVLLLASAGSLLGIACYGLVQEVFYVHALRLLFFASLGMLAAATSALPGWSRATTQLLWLMLAVAFVEHLGYEYWKPGPARLLRDYTATGLHGEEPRPGDTPFRWSSEWTTWPVPNDATGFALQVRSLTPFAQTVDVAACDGGRWQVVLSDHNWHELGGTLAGCGWRGRLQLRVSPSWRPAGDGRLLGVMTAGLRFQRPDGGWGAVGPVLR